MYFAFVEAGRDHLDGVAVGILGRKGEGEEILITDTHRHAPASIAIQRALERHSPV